MTSDGGASSDLISINARNTSASSCAAISRALRTRANRRCRVLLQTPAHAAAEISRVMTAVESNRMPRDELGIEKELDAGTKAVLLKYGAALESTVKAAYAWERGD